MKIRLAMLCLLCAVFASGDSIAQQPQVTAIRAGRLIDPERADYCERRYELTHTAAAIILEGWS